MNLLLMNQFPGKVLRRLLCLWGGFVSCVCLVAQVQAEGPVRFTVATWNLEWFFDEHTGDNSSALSKQQSAPTRADWDWKRDAVAAAIAQLNVDVIGLQEIENGKVLWYLTRALARNHSQEFEVAFSEGSDLFTEQDVGFLYRNVEALRVTRHFRPTRDSGDTTYYDISKHLEFEGLVDGQKLVVLNIHFRSKPEGAELRLRQARLLRRWIADRIAGGTEVIILGDTNSETVAGQVSPTSDVGILMGLDTPDPRDDLIDLHSRLAPGQGQTHLIPGKQFDRILVTPGLMVDDPSRKDLVFSGVQVRTDVGIRGAGPDVPEVHWEKYWAISESERDISDHYPVVATFELR